jgi:hypothetical protein
MSLATIRPRHAVTHADHTQDLARDRATAVVAHTRVAAVVDTHPIVAVDHRLTVGEEALLHTVAVAEVIANHTPALALIASGSKP